MVPPPGLPPPPQKNDLRRAERRARHQQQQQLRRSVDDGLAQLPTAPDRSILAASDPGSDAVGNDATDDATGDSGTPASSFVSGPTAVKKKRQPRATATTVLPSVDKSGAKNERRAQERRRRIAARYGAGDDDHALSASLPPPARNDAELAPGAVRVSGNEYDDGNPSLANEEASAMMTTSERGSTQHLVHAFVVGEGDGNGNGNDSDDSSKVLVAATPVVNAFWMRRRLLIAAGIIIVIIVAVLLTVIFTVPGIGVAGGSSSSSTENVTTVVVFSSESPTMSPMPSASPSTSPPTDSPTDHPSHNPTDRPSETPTDNPTDSPTFGPTPSPSDRPLEWLQLGGTLDLISNDEHGYSVALSDNGLVLAAGAPMASSVRIYRYIDEQWIRIGFASASFSSESGRSVSLSGDGTIVAFGSPTYRDDFDEDPFGRVDVVRLDPDTEEYVAMGDPINGTEVNGQFGYTVSLSDDGMRLAVGALNTCFAQVYEFDGTTWQALGAGLGCFVDELSSINPFSSTFVSAIKLSRDGDTVALGVPGLSFRSIFTESGRVRVYKLNESNEWIQLGQELTGENRADDFGTSLALANNGLTLAVGAPLHDGSRGPNSVPTEGFNADPNTGRARIFDFDVDASMWKQRGSGILGRDAIGDLFGTSIALSDDGNVVAVGAPNGDLNGDDSGLVGVYRYSGSDWMLVYDFLVGRTPNGIAGISVALNGDGTIVSLGAPTNEELIQRQGFVQVYATGATSAGNQADNVELEIDLEFGMLFENYIGWKIERLDAYAGSGGEVRFASVPSGTYAEDSTGATHSVSVEPGGLYRFYIDMVSEFNNPLRDRDPTGTFRISLDPMDGRNLQLITEQNFGNSGQATFLVAPNAGTQIPDESSFVQLELDFDNRPQEIHWILKASWEVRNDNGRPRRQDAIVAFGPETEYPADRAGGVTFETIDVSSVPVTSLFQLILIDTGINGLCCENGSGMYRLYAGLEQGSVLVENASGVFRRRISHTFRLPDGNETRV